MSNAVIEIYDKNGILQTGLGIGVVSITATAPLGNTGTATNPVIALTSTVDTTHGGTGQNLSGTGSSTAFLAQDGSHVLSVRSIVDGDLPTALAGHTITGGSVNNTPIGASTANTLIASAISLLIGGFKAIFTHANSADRTYTLPDYNATLATIAGTETLTNKTLTAPTVSDFTNANHDHSATNKGGAIPISSLGSGILGLIKGGTGSDLSGTGAGFLKQTGVGANVSVAALAAGDIPNLAASKITSGQMALAQGGTGVDLSASGGAHSFLAEDGSHVVSARTIASGDLPTVGVSQGGTGQSAAGADDTWLRSNSNVGALTEWALTAQAFSGRLSLSSTLSVSGDIAASNDLYWLPYLGNKVRIPSVNGLDTYLTLGDSGVHLTATGASLLPCYCYDIFGFNNSGSPSAEFLAWNAPTNAAITAISNANPPVVSTGTTPTADQIVVITGAAGAGAANINNIQFRVGTVSAGVSFQLLASDGTNPGAPGVITSSTGTWFRYDAAQTRATAIDFANGVYYKHAATSRIYLGSVKMDEAGKFNDTSAKRRLLFNYFNRIERNVLAQDSTASWSYATATWRPSRNTLANRVEFMAGVIEEIFKSRVHQSQQSSSSGGAVSIGSMTITANSAQTTNEASATALNGIASNLSGPVSLGYQYLQSVEYVRTGTVTYYGGTGTFADNLYGLLAEVKM